VTDLTLHAAPIGAYGLRVEGLDEAAEWMRPVEPDAPVLRVEASRGDPFEATEQVDERCVDVHLRGLSDARMRMDRGSRRARYAFTDLPPAADLLHPYLAPAAALAHAWEGREAIHAGAFATQAGAVLLLGGKEAGKSSLLAWLAAELGCEVLADDLCVLSDGAVLPGPSCVDLREPTVRRYGTRWNGRVVRSNERLRLALSPGAAAPLQVAATVVLAWGESVRIEPVILSERLALLAPQRYFGALEADPVAVLDLASRPMFRLERPPDLDVLPATAEALLARFS
jgi:hypothetical protein